MDGGEYVSVKKPSKYLTCIQDRRNSSGKIVQPVAGNGEISERTAESDGKMLENICGKLYNIHNTALRDNGLSYKVYIKIMLFSIAFVQLIC